VTDGWIHPAGAGGTHGEPPAPLPEPLRRRWQPLRAGLVDLFFYDREEFWFRDGHLLLRGNNGTGKSKVLALLLPFLLDGEVAPHRVEPDGDASKRMEWNLLLGGRYDERIGYTWLELGRVDADGRTRYLTLGCGLKAVAGRGAPARWFFTTDQRVGVDLWLVNPTGTAKTKDRLADALDGRGAVVEGPTAWRRTVDERLFDLGAERYGALLELLISLRQPQLSKRPNEQALSAALTQALAPPDQAIIADVAEAFRSLEAERSDVEALAEAQAAVAAFRDRYRRYAAVASRRRAADVRTAQSEYEKAGRRLATATEQLEAARVAEAEAAGAVRALDDAIRGHTAADRALRESPAMQQAATLDEVRKAAEAAEREAGDAGRRASDAEADHADAAERVARAEQAAAASRSALDEALAAADAAAEQAGLVATHADALAAYERGDRDRARSLAGEAITRRERDARHVLGLVAAVEHAELERARRRQRRDDKASEHDAAAERQAALEDVAGRSAAELVAAVDAWARGCAALDGLDAEALAAATAAWAAALDGPFPASAAARAAAERANRRLADAAARLTGERDDAQAEQRSLRAERDRLAAGGVDAPPAPPTRADGVRDGRAGAPLWQAVDFADHLDDRARAGLEAALEASGLLDAWVTPDGRLLDADTLDTVVVAAAAVERSLTEALRPAVDRTDVQAAALTDDAVTAVLRGIGLGAGTAASWMDTDGAWALGVAHGRWAKPAARYVGHAAREAARRARLAEIDADLAALDDRLADVAAALEEVAAERDHVVREHDAVPDDAPLRDASGKAAHAAEEVRRLAEEVARLDAAVADASAARDDAAAERDDAARDLAAPADRDALEALLGAVTEYRVTVTALWPAADRHHETVERITHLRDEAARRAQAAATAAAESAARQRVALEERRRHDELHAAVGADVAELERRLAEVARLLAGARAERDAVDRRRQDNHDAAVRGETQAALFTEQREQAASRRTAATAAFQRFAAHGLLAAGAPDVELPDVAAAWAPDPTVRLARRVEEALEAADASDAAWERLQRQITDDFKTLADALSRHGHHATADLTDDGFVVTIAYQNRPATPAELADQLAADLADRERLLSARERELLENHLVADVATHLQELISRADAQLAATNRELADRPTSTGMQLRLVWKPRSDAPAALEQARRRLLQTADAWSADDRAAVGAFLQDQIAAVRAGSEGGTWLEHLTEALDYRRWHTFAVERRQDGEWRSASGPASGGERALAVTLPLFAAASSFYATAGNPHAPRLVLLDEAFAGVDDDARAKCMGLLAEFDLDFVMTSEREWGCYAALPGLGIAQLARRDGIDAVHVTRWEWDGRARSRVDVALPTLREPEPSP
jgi:uncharacterized protein (TIGR02680 family)